jgi:hypothetical protein
MNDEQHIWRVWAEFLQRWGVEDWVAALLEAAGPLSILGAQFVYLSQPLLNQAMPGNHLAVLARLLEEPARTQVFVEYLREASAP